MMLAVFISVTLSLLLVSGSQPHSWFCDYLLKPQKININNETPRKWFLVAWSSDQPDSKRIQTNSAWMDVLVTTPYKTVAVSQFFNLNSIILPSEVATFLDINLESKD